MNRAVYKYTLAPVVGPQILRLPRRALFLHFAIQHSSELNVWFLVNPMEGAGSWADGKELVEERTFRIVGTGHPFPATDLHHLATALTADTTFVWHLFEERAEMGLQDLAKDKDVYYHSPPGDTGSSDSPSPWDNQDSVKGIAEQEHEYRGMV